LERRINKLIEIFPTRRKEGYEKGGYWRGKTRMKFEERQMS